MESKIEIIQIDENLSIHFVYVPEGYKMKKVNLSGHETKKLGELKNLNRIKILNNWKIKNGCLVNLFTDVLIKRNWDFNKFPNPTAYAARLTGK